MEMGESRVNSLDEKIFAVGTDTPGSSTTYQASGTSQGVNSSPIPLAKAASNNSLIDRHDQQTQTPVLLRTMTAYQRNGYKAMAP